MARKLDPNDPEDFETLVDIFTEQGLEFHVIRNIVFHKKNREIKNSQLSIDNNVIMSEFKFWQQIYYNYLESTD